MEASHIVSGGRNWVELRNLRLASIALILSSRPNPEAHPQLVTECSNTWGTFLI